MGTNNLSDKQLELFNTDLMQPYYWEIFLSTLESRIDTTKDFSILDLGGGIGMFADHILELYPNASVTVLDNAQYLLSRNKPHSRKQLIYCSIADIKTTLKGKEFDLITFNWVLHHLVGSTHRASLSNASQALNDASTLLKENGYISIIENLYNGMMIDSFPSRFIYAITSIRFAPFAKIVNKAGFNTSGVGVNFMSEKIIAKVIAKARLKIN